MWHTSRGDRTLRGAEAQLIAQAVDTMIDGLLTNIDDDLESNGLGVCQSGIAVFDSLLPSQRIGLLYDVTRHLLTVTDSTLPLSAAVEAAVAAVFIEVRDQVAIEIDLFPDGRVDEMDAENATWRQLVLAAYTSVFRTPHDPQDGFDGDFEMEQAAAELFDLPDDHCRDMMAWEELVDALADVILWDRDFEMAETFLDVDPGVSRQRRRLLGIDDEYFTKVAPDPRPDEALQLVALTRDIVRAKPR